MIAFFGTKGDMARRDGLFCTALKEFKISFRRALTNADYFAIMGVGKSINFF